jgi:integrase
MMKQNQTHRRIGQVIRKGDNKWLIRIFRGKDSEGKRKFHNEIVNGTKGEAEKFLRAKMVEIESGNLVEPKNRTLDKFLDQWLSLRQPALAERTFDDYAEMLTRYVRSTLGSREVSSLTREDIQTLYTSLLTRGLSNRTVIYTHIILNAALKWGVKVGLIRANPAADTERPKKKQKEMRVLTPPEVKRFLDAIKKDSYEALFVLALDSGMRPEEYLGLKWEDVDLERGTVTVKRTLCRKRKKVDGMVRALYLGTPKTSKSRRTILLSKTTIFYLRSHQPSDCDPGNFVFVARNGHPVIAESLTRNHFKPALKKAQLPNIRLYDLRHTMATALLVAGVNPKIVSERLGHASIVLTLDTYSHVIPGLQELATEKLEEVLFK